MDLRKSIYDEYVLALSEVKKRKGQMHGLKKGDLVMLLESGDLKKKVNLGIIEATHPGAGDVERVVDI